MLSSAVTKHTAPSSAGVSSAVLKLWSDIHELAPLVCLPPPTPPQVAVAPDDKTLDTVRDNDELVLLTTAAVTHAIGDSLSPHID
jgi:hypothetical protein